jgi:hypothetical protein
MTNHVLGYDLSFDSPTRPPNQTALMSLLVLGDDLSFDGPTRPPNQTALMSLFDAIEHFQNSTQQSMNRKHQIDDR